MIRDEHLNGFLKIHRNANGMGEVVPTAEAQQAESRPVAPCSARFHQAVDSVQVRS